VVTYDNSSASNVPTIYVNGVQQSLIFSSTPVGTANSDAAQNLVIGNSSNASDRTFDGQIDELQISSTIRSSDWVTQQYRTIFSASTTSASVQSRPTGLLLNDTDSDIDPLTVSLVSGPAHALSFTLNTDGSFTYQHNGDFVATDSFTYQLSDGQGGVSTATANFAIQWTNTPPTISAIADRTVAEDTASGSIAFTIGDLETSTNALVTTVSSSNQSLITNAGIVLGGTGANRSISFTPQSDENGSAVVQITVDDGTRTTTRNVIVTVDAVNDAPIAVSDSLTAEQSAPTIIRRSALLANDIEQDGDSLIIEVVGQPSFGTLDVLPNGNLRYQHTASGTTSDSFTYRVFDGVVWSNPVGVSLSISSLPPPGFILVPGGNSIVLPSQNDSGSDGNSTEPSQSDSKSSDTPAIEPKKDSKPIAASLAGMVIAPGTQSLNDQAKESESGLVMLESNTSLVSPRTSSERAVQIDGTVSDRGRSLSLPAIQGDESAMMSTTISTYSPTQFAVTQPQLWLALDSMKQEMSTSLAVSSGLTVGAAATTSVGMTVGYVVWVLRSGLLLSSVMAHLPMWRFMDPLAILDSSESHADEDEETLGSIADGDTSSESEDHKEVAEIEANEIGVENAVKIGEQS